MKIKQGDWVLTNSGCIVQVALLFKDDYHIGIRVDAKDVARPMSRHAIVRVVPDPKELLPLEEVLSWIKRVQEFMSKEGSKSKAIKGKLQKPSTKTKNGPY
jgi:hypothetical protein